MIRTNFIWFKKHLLEYSILKKLIWLAVLSLLGIGVWVSQSLWKPHTQRFMDYIQNKKTNSEEDAEEAAPSETPDTLTLSPTAWKNIGLETASVRPRDFEKAVSVPAMVVERPGRSNNDITAPMTGVVTQVYPLERQAIEPGGRSR